MEIKFKHHLVIEFRLIKGVGDNLWGHRDRCMTVSTNSKAVVPSPLKGISVNHDLLHPQVARRGAKLPYHLFRCNQKGNQERGFIMYLFFRMEYILLGRSRTGVGVGVDIFRPESESESESLNIHRLCSPGQDTSILAYTLRSRVNMGYHASWT